MIEPADAFGLFGTIRPLFPRDEADQGKEKEKEPLEEKEGEKGKQKGENSQADAIGVLSRSLANGVGGAFWAVYTGWLFLGIFASRIAQQAWARGVCWANLQDIDLFSFFLLFSPSCSLLFSFSILPSTHPAATVALGCLCLSKPDRKGHSGSRNHDKHDTCQFPIPSSRIRIGIRA